MHFLYGAKPDTTKKLVATFDSEQQLLAYVRWATLQQKDDQTLKFEQGSVLIGYPGYEHSRRPLTPDDAENVPHNPSPSML